MNDISNLRFTTSHTGVMAFVGWMCYMLGISEVVDELLSWDDRRCKLAPSLRLKALVMAMIFDRTALYRMSEFFAAEDVAVLLGHGMSAEDLTDDALARFLDKLHAAGGAKVFTSACAKALTAMGVPWEELQSAHFDTTSVNVYGAYQDPEAALRIVPGFSKDGHPELNQFQIGILATAHGLPATGMVLDGNCEDGKTNGKLLEFLGENLPAEQLQGLLYVADCKFVAPDNLNRAEQLHLNFVSRLPSTYAACGQVKDEAWRRSLWIEVGRLSEEPDAASYLVQELPVCITDREYRAVVVRSDSLDKRKQKTIQRQVDQERQAAQRRLKEFSRNGFACAADARAAAERLRRDLRFWELKFTVEEVVQQLRRERPGRPAKGATVPTRTSQVVQGELVLNQAAVEEARQRAGTFVLISNDHRHDAVSLLRQYKDQQTANEIPFHVIKALPVAPVFFKREHRVEAFVWVALLAYLVYASTQYLVRTALAGLGEKLVVPGKREVAAPTARSIFDMLETVKTARISLDGGLTWTRQVERISNEVRKLLYLLKVPMSIYLKEPCG